MGSGSDLGIDILSKSIYGRNAISKWASLLIKAEKAYIELIRPIDIDFIAIDLGKDGHCAVEDNRQLTPFSYIEK